MKFTYAGGTRPLDGYTIKRGIGRGGFGEVYYAVSDGGKEVALKLIRRNLEIELRGVTACLNLKHPNLLALFDTRRDAQDDTWVVMEYIGGESLEETLARHPEGLPVDEALAWLAGIAAGVGYLHDRGIVHRDLKPGNVFSDEGCVKLGDYGLSKFISASRRSGQTESVGTVHYMAPEVANGRYGREIDIYALGVMLYEMLTGRLPFEGESVGEVLMKHLTAQPDLGNLAEPYRAVVARCLEKDPANRFQTVSEMLACLPVSKRSSVSALPSSNDARLEDTMAWRGGAAPPPIAPVAAMAGVAAGTGFIENEPIYCFCRDTCSELHAAWIGAQLNAPVRAVLMVLFALAMVSVSGILLSLAVPYAIYLGGRAVWLNWQPQQVGHLAAPSAPVAQYVTPQLVQPAPAAPLRAVPPPMPSTTRRTARLSRRRQRQAAVQAALAPKSPREHLTDTLGAMLLAAAVCAAISVVAGVFTQTQPERLVWLALVGTVGSWSILVPAKFWEGREGEEILRRFVLLCGGLGVGLVAFGLDHVLLVDLPSNPELRFVGSPAFDGGDIFGDPIATDYLAYFGLLFPLLRWWKQADPARSARFNPWSLAVCSVAALVLGQFWSFPQPWGMWVAASISGATQLASPWHDPREVGYAQAA